MIRIKRYKILFVICLLILGSTVACQKNDIQNTPTSATLFMLENAPFLTYEEFKDEYMQGEGNWISKEQFSEFKSKIKYTKDYESTGTTVFNVVTFDNGEMMLIRLVNSTGLYDYKVDGVKIIPDEMKELFMD